MSSTKQINYFHQLDAIRGIASIIVVAVHMKVFMAVSIGYGCMHMFFLLSTVLVTKSLLHDLKKHKEFKCSIKQFALKRIGRILPVYFLYLILVFFSSSLLFLLAHQKTSVFIEFKKYGFLLASFTYNLKEWWQLITIHKFDQITLLTPHLWSISYEMQLYFFLFFVIYFFNKTTIVKLAWFAILILPIIRIAAYYYLQTETKDELLIAYLIQRCPLFHIDLFSFGFLLVFKPLTNEKLWRNILIISTIIIIATSYGFAYYNAQLNNLSAFEVLHQDKFIYQHYGIFYFDNLINIFCFSLIGYIINFKNRIKFLNNNFLIKVGEISYITYVFQMLFVSGAAVIAVLLAMLKILKASTFVIVYIIVVIVVFVSIYFFSTFLHKKFELPLLIKKDKWIENYLKL
jgi:peptidoglycan/LPS O-acetylase OafA/YrhL